MYPTLSDLIADLTGIYIPLPIYTFGFFMALSFLIGAWLLHYHFTRLEGEGRLLPTHEKQLIGEPASVWSIVSNAILGFILGYKGGYALLHWTAFSQHPQDFLVDGTGSWIGGIVFALALAALHYYEKRKAQLPEPLEVEQTIYPHERVGDIIVIAALTGIIGAKIFTWIEDIDAFIADPIGALLSFSGLTFYGGLIVAALSLLWYARKKNIHIGHLVDSAATVLILGYGIGRLGCHFSGDGDWGIVNTAPPPFSMPAWLWSYTYPHNVNREGVPIPDCVGNYCMQLPEGVYPTSVYEFLMAFSIFLFLFLLTKRVRTPGSVFAIYLILNGLERFSIEFIRHNDLYNVLGVMLSQAQIIAIGLMTIGTILLVVLLRQRKTISQ